MGIYINPGYKRFQEAVSSEIYIEIYLCEQTTSFWKINCCKYACCILWL